MVFNEDLWMQFPDLAFDMTSWQEEAPMEWPMRAMGGLPAPSICSLTYAALCDTCSFSEKSCGKHTIRHHLEKTSIIMAISSMLQIKFWTGLGK